MIRKYTRSTLLGRIRRGTSINLQPRVFPENVSIHQGYIAKSKYNYVSTLIHKYVEITVDLTALIKNGLFM